MQALMCRGVAYADVKEFGKALQDFTQILEAKPRKCVSDCA